jgi:predicted MFS family arabinose efflux permease
MFGLVIAMGIGRFAYTPLLPMMQQEYGFGTDMAGGLATVNYGGYLLGALLCMLPAVDARRGWLFRGSLLLSVGTTAAMGLTDTISIWWGIRLLSGLASAGVMVLGSAIALDTLTQRGAGGWRGFIYSGIGAGIALSGVVVLALDQFLYARGLWVVLALLCLPLVVASWHLVPQCSPHSAPHAAPHGIPAPMRLPPLIPWLVVAYCSVGLGYIVSGTFLVAIVQANTASTTAGTMTWVIVGVAAVGSTLVWPALAARFGDVHALVAAHALQALGILLPVLSPGVVAASVGAFLFGGTFMGIVALTMSLGQHLAPRRSARILGLLTTVYGAGQMIGPLLAGVLAEYTESFTLPLVGAAVVVAVGGIVLVVGTGLGRWYQTQSLKGEVYAIREY